MKDLLVEIMSLHGLLELFGPPRWVWLCQHLLAAVTALSRNPTIYGMCSVPPCFQAHRKTISSEQGHLYMILRRCAWKSEPVRKVKWRLQWWSSGSIPGPIGFQLPVDLRDNYGHAFRFFICGPYLKHKISPERLNIKDVLLKDKSICDL